MTFQIPTRSNMDRIFHGMATAFPDIILFTDVHGNIKKVTATGEKLLKYQKNELQNMSAQDILLPRFRDIFGNVSAPEQTYDIPARPTHCVCRAKDNSRLPVEIRWAENNDSDAPEQDPFVIIRSRQQAKMHEQRVMEKERAVATGQLASCIGHEISNPLSVIKLYSEWMTSELKNSGSTKPDEELIAHLRKSIGNVGDAAARIEDIITNMREYARSTEQKVTQIELKDAIADALYYMDRELRASSIRVETDLPDSECPIKAQPDQLRQVFIHLISNACDAFYSRNIGQNYPVLHIQVRKTTSDFNEKILQYECSVADNGPGMNEAVQDQIYTPFFSNNKENAAGLGLPVVRNIVRRHGGNLQIMSEAGNGTSVVFQIPAQPQSMIAKSAD